MSSVARAAPAIAVAVLLAACGQKASVESAMGPQGPEMVPAPGSISVAPPVARAAAMRRPPPPEVDGTVLPLARVRALFGSFSFERGKGDAIVPDPRWVSAAIVDYRVPVIGTVRCHRNIVLQLYYAMAEIERAGLASAIHSYDGCYVPRTQRGSRRALSAHAFGIAIDLDAATNMPGRRPRIDRGVVEIMERWGFRWGGRFSPPDGMHFEFVRYPG